jgi:prepilin-type N-terminal cleavage/methylation domain-containing protein
MRKMSSSGIKRPASRLASFTLIELLTVIAIIAILAALTLYAGTAVLNKAARSRAASEIQAMSTALEGYKTDNGIYPIGTTTAGSSSSLLGPPTVAYSLDPTAATYQTSSEALFQALSGITNYATDLPLAGVKSYMPFKINQIGNSAGPSYIKDPWNYSYGYSSGDNKSPQVQYPYNGAGFFDLWSTGGITLAKVTATPSLTNAWISNWQ